MLPSSLSAGRTMESGGGMNPEMFLQGFTAVKPGPRGGQPLVDQGLDGPRDGLRGQAVAGRAPVRIVVEVKGKLLRGLEVREQGDDRVGHPAPQLLEKPEGLEGVGSKTGVLVTL